MIVSLLPHRRDQGRHLPSIITAVMPNKASMALQIDHTEKSELPRLAKYFHHSYPRETHTDQQESFTGKKKSEAFSLGYKLSFGYVKFEMPKEAYV